jgi:prepilin-type N-terminal cleavage/methylation domain-containing protein
VKNTTKNQQGFTIIEIVVTLFIIGVTLILFRATANSLLLNKSDRFREIALHIADKKLQTVRTTTFASIPASGTFTDTQLSTIPNGQATMTVTDINSKLKDVSIVVTWSGPKNGSTQQVHLETYVASGGLGQ